MLEANFQRQVVLENGIYNGLREYLKIVDNLSNLVKINENVYCFVTTLKA